MDPLSITASVVGLLGAAGKVASLLHKVRSALVEAPRFMDQLLSQVKELEACLAAVNGFILKIQSAPRRRISLIQVDQLVVTLTDLVLAFSELEPLVSSVASSVDDRILDRIKIAWKEDTISKISTRLDRHKTTLSLMLNIVQCESDLEAERSQETLHELVEQLLKSNLDISRRLQTLEDSYDSESIRTIRSGNDRNAEATYLGRRSVEEAEDFANEPLSATTSLAATSLYEADLDTSRVYSRTRQYDLDDASFRTSTIRTHAWSVFSGLSLSQVSSISAIALPVYAADLSNNERYHFGASDQPSVPHRAFHRLLVLGDQETSIANELLLYGFNKSPEGNTQGFYRKEIPHSNETIDLLDTTIPDADKNLRNWWLPRADGLLLVFSTSSLASFKSAWSLHLRAKVFREKYIKGTTAWCLQPENYFVPSRPPLDDRLCLLAGCNTAGGMPRGIGVGEARTMAVGLGCLYAEFSPDEHGALREMLDHLVAKVVQS